MQIKPYYSLAVILLAIMATAAFSVPRANAASLEYPYIYKSSKTLAMGGANVAIGGGFESVFYNPAGIAHDEEEGWDILVLNLNVSINNYTVSFGEDISDALDADDLNNDGDNEDEQLRALNDVFNHFQGTNIHFNATNLSYAAKKFGDYSLGIGIIVSQKVDAIPHQGFGSSGLLEVDSVKQTGMVLGASTEPIRGLKSGFSVKFINREVVKHSFTANELIANQDNLSDYITDELSEEGSGLGLDAGVMYSFWHYSKIRPTLGLSVMDIGDTDYGSAGTMPMTVNLGISATGDLMVFKTLTVGLDYVDVLNNYEQDDDWGKRVRVGGELVVEDSEALRSAIRAGLYQGYPSFGFIFSFTAVSISYTSYAEELGAYAGQDMDRRHLLTVKIGW
jgi:hypothetical protein